MDRFQTAGSSLLALFLLTAVLICACSQKTPPFECSDPIVLQTEDTGCTREGGANAALKIIADPQMVAILGTACSSAAAAASRAMSDAGPTRVTGNNSAPFLTSIAGKQAPDWQPGYFRTSCNEETSGKAAAIYAFEAPGVRTKPLPSTTETSTPGS